MARRKSWQSVNGKEEKNHRERLSRTRRDTNRKSIECDVVWCCGRNTVWLCTSANITSCLITRKKKLERQHHRQPLFSLAASIWESARLSEATTTETSFLYPKATTAGCFPSDDATAQAMQQLRFYISAQISSALSIPCWHNNGQWLYTATAYTMRRALFCFFFRLHIYKRGCYIFVYKLWIFTCIKTQINVWKSPDQEFRSVNWDVIYYCCYDTSLNILVNKGRRRSK